MSLSIVIPYYNSADMLPPLLDSIIAECRDTQIIVVDDNSTENTETFEKIKADYSDKVEFYVNDSGVKGAGAARNIGLSKASGDWLLFSDADDVFLTGWYEAVSSYFDKEYDIVYFNPVSKDIATGGSGKRHLMYTKYVTEFVKSGGCRNDELYLRYFFIVPWSKLIRAKIVRDNEVTFDEVRYSNDVMFSIKTGFYAGSISADLRTVYCVTENSGGLTTDMSEEAWGIRHEVFSRRNLFLREHLTRKDYAFNKTRMGAFGRLIVAVYRKCGFKNFIRYCRMYRENKVPVVYSALWLIRCKIALLVKGQKP